MDDEFKLRVLTHVSNDNKIISKEELRIIFGIKSDHSLRASKLNVKDETIEGLSLIYDVYDDDIDYSKYVNLENFNESFSLEASGDEENKDTEKDDEKKDDEIGKSILSVILTKLTKIKANLNNYEMVLKKFGEKILIGRERFFNKYLDKVDSLYKHYAKDAMIVENELNGDPAKILTESANKYLQQLIDAILKARIDFNEVVMKSINSYDYDDMVNICKKFITYKGIELKDNPKPAKLITAVRLEFRYRLAKALLNGNDIYGYSIETIVYKKFPPINHVIISLFVPKPHEKPVRQSVADIFDSPESFKLIHKKLKDVVYESNKLVNNKLKTIDDNSKVKKSIVLYKKYKKVYNAKIDATSLAKSSNLKGSKDVAKVKKSNFNKCKSLLRRQINSYSLFVPIFMYVSDAGMALYKMSLQIDRTCQDAIKAMLNAENESTDKVNSYKSDQTSKSKKKFKTSNDNATDEMVK